jgi:hypothetical protein
MECYLDRRGISWHMKQIDSSLISLRCLRSEKSKNGQARCLAVSIYVDRRRNVFNSAHSPHGPFKGRVLQQTSQVLKNLVYPLLLDESIVSPEAFRIAIARIDEFHVMSDDAHHAET